MVDRDKLAQMLRRAQPEIMLIITFADGRVEIGLHFLYVLHQSGYVVISPVDIRQVEADLNLRGYKSPQKRSVRFRICSKEGLFENMLLLVDHTESIGAADDHPLKALVTRRIELQRRLADGVLKILVTPVVKVEASSWGLTLSAAFNAVQDFPAFTVDIMNGAAVQLTITVDCWSGGIFAGECYLARYAGPDALEHHLITQLTAVAEKLAG